MRHGFAMWATETTWGPGRSQKPDQSAPEKSERLIKEAHVTKPETVEWGMRARGDQEMSNKEEGTIKVTHHLTRDGVYFPLWKCHTKLTNYSSPPTYTPLGI